MLAIQLRNPLTPTVSTSQSSTHSFVMRGPASPMRSPSSSVSPHSPTRSRATNHVEPMERLARFSACPSVTLLRTNYGNKVSKHPPSVVTTCVSSSGDTLAIVEETEYRVYKSFSSQTSTGKPKCVGRFEDNGLYRSGLDGPQARSHGHIMDDKKKLWASNSSTAAEKFA